MAKPKHTNTQFDPLPDLPNYDPAPADGVRVGESPVPGLTLRRILRGHTDCIHRIAWSPDGSRLGSASVDGTILIWDSGNANELIQIESGADHETDFSWSWNPDGERIAACTKTGLVVCEASTGHRIWAIEYAPEHVQRALWSPQGDLIVRVLMMVQ